MAECHEIDTEAKAKNEVKKEMEEEKQEKLKEEIRQKEEVENVIRGTPHAQIS